MKFCAIVATHHKTGTVWMRSIFRHIAERLDIPFSVIKVEETHESKRFSVPKILLNNHSHFLNTPWMLSHPECRLLHIIRDPRDVLISAMTYHRTARERWLHRAQHEFQGQTYQEKLNSLPDDYSRYLFEMENSTKRIINDMRAWNYQMQNSFECRYEDLVADENMELFTSALTRLGFENGEMEICLEEVWKNSLFGGRGKNREHVRSGESRQWPKIFNRCLAETFLQKFGDALVMLGYEPDNAWASQLPD